jgi:hypothetical protein
MPQVMYFAALPKNPGAEDVYTKKEGSAQLWREDFIPSNF